MQEQFDKTLPMWSSLEKKRGQDLVQIVERTMGVGTRGWDVLKWRLVEKIKERMEVCS